MPSYPRWLLPLVVGLVLVYLNYWMWDVGRIVLGMPANLLYHVIWSVGLVPIMLAVVRRAWPRCLDGD